MTEEKKSMVPKLRFPEFTATWEQRELNTAATFLNGRAFSQSELLSKGKYPVLRVGNFYTNDKWYFSDLVLPEKFYANKGDLLYTWSATFGPHIWEGDKVIYHYHIWKLLPGKDTDKAFLLSLLQRDRETLLQGSNGSTMIHITKQAMEAKKLFFPRSQKEQRQIGIFFKTIDKAITLHQRKLEGLSKLKKSLLQKMFPKNGSLGPELRFPGFTGDWEQRKLGEIVQLNGRIGFRGYTQKDIVSKESGGILTFSPTNIVDNVLSTDCKNTYITRSKYEESPEIQVHNNDILFVKTGSTLGKSALVRNLKEASTINPQLVVIRSQIFNPDFLARILCTDGVLKQVRASRIGGAIPTLTETEIKKFRINTPKEAEEAKKIGAFFNFLDESIALHQRKLESLKKLKKSLLQQMFV